MFKSIACRSLVVILFLFCISGNVFADCGQCSAESATKTPPACCPSKATCSSKILTGSGLSGLVDGAKAGEKAAKAAQKAFGPGKPKLVLVFAGRKQLTPDMVKSVASVFPEEIIYGCEGYSPLTHEGNLAGAHESDGVAVLALGGKINVFTATADTKDMTQVQGQEPEMAGFYNSGKKLGEALKDSIPTCSKGKILLTFGDQHVGQNIPYLAGLTSVLGDDVSIVGAAAGDSNAKEIVKGKIVTATNVGILLTGDFKLGLATRKDNSKEGLVNSADEAFTKALNGGKDKASLIFVFDCGGRRGSLNENGDLEKELDAMKALAGNCGIFGFYGGGEIGHADNDSPAKAVGWSISTCALIEK
jgi:hypothetical protein